MATFDQLLLLFSGIGGLQGFLLATYLFFRQPGQWSNRFLAALILVLSVRILKSVLFYFNPALGKQVLQLGLSACFLIGPILYCYTLQFLGRFGVNRWHRLHWLLPLLILLLVGVCFPYQAYPLLWGSLFYRLINAIWLIYNLLALLLLWPGLLRLRLANWREDVDRLIVLAVVAGSLVIWSAYYFASYTSYISGALVFSFSLLLGIVTGVFTVKPVTPLPYADKKIAEDEVRLLLQELEQKMVRQQMYLDSNLSLPRLAKQLGCSVPKLSQLLNDNLQTSFNDYINTFRIDYAKTLLRADAPMKMDELAERSGFNSLSTFYSAFKKHTQVTPAKFKSLQR